MKTLQFVLALTLGFAAGCVPEPDPTTIILLNEGEAEVFHDVSRWVSLEVDGKPASLDEPGCMQKCGSLGGNIVCALAAEYPTVVRLRSGEQSTREWDGTYYEIEPDANCYKEKRRDTDFALRFCYSGEFEPLEGEIADEGGDIIGGAYIKDPVCEVQAFERGDTVTLSAE